VKQGFVEHLFAWLYTSRLGRRVRPLLLESKRLHAFVDWYCDTRLSRAHIDYVVRRYRIDLSPVEVPAAGFRTFNDFFTRRLKPGARAFDPDPSVLCSPADSHLFVLPEVDRKTAVEVKGVPMNLSEMLDSDRDAAAFDGGSVAVFRLHARDCHRVYFPCAGVPHAPRRIAGHHYAVTPFPGNDVSHFAVNQRTVTWFDSDTFGPMAFVDIGGFCISSIVATFTPGLRVTKGGEKSCFRYGGSTHVICAPRKALHYEPRFVAASKAGNESPVVIGERVASCSAFP